MFKPIAKLKIWIRQHTCKHDFQSYRKENAYGFRNLSGDRVYVMCKKCGKMKDSYFVKH